MADVARQVIVSFLTKTGVTAQFPPMSPPLCVETKVREIIQSWDLDISKDKYEKYIVTGVHTGYAFFQHASYDVQVAFSLFSFCVIIFDDSVGLVDPNAIRDFVPRFCDRKPQLAPILDRMIEATTNLRPFLHEYAANAVHSALLMYANEELWYTQRAQKLVLRPDAGRYIEYSRYKSEIGRAHV